jgi:hypothetical protein
MEDVSVAIHQMIQSLISLVGNLSGESDGLPKSITEVEW